MIMKIGVVGLGDICQKAYLPVLSVKDGIDLILCTRNLDTLKKVSVKYRIERHTQSVEDLIDAGIDAAFVHTATESHVSILNKLLSNNVHVYVDKPISYHYEDAEAIAELAAQKGRIVMVGFNRRFAPLYQRLQDHGNPDIVLMQKNRVSLPGDPRTFVFDDFIHVVDTLRFLTGHQSLDIRVRGRYENGRLYNVMLELMGLRAAAMGIMNRDSGKSEEVVEYMCPSNKFVVKDLIHLHHLHNNTEIAEKPNDWEPTLYKRGFYQIVDHFVACIEGGGKSSPSLEDSLITHRLCEQIVKALPSE
jgi:virulence factor